LEKSYLEGQDQLSLILLDSQISFKLVIVDDQDDRLGLSNIADIQINIDGSSTTKPEIKQQEDGSYLVTWQADQTGDHQFNVLLDGVHLKGSPFTITAIKGGGFGPAMPQQPFLGSIGISSHLFSPSSTSTVYQFQHPSKGPDSLPEIPAPLLKEWFPKTNNFELLYSLKQDGASNHTFHKQCDNQGPTVTLVTLQNGCIFGGYASQSWTSQNQWIAAPGSFIFSVTDGKGRPPMKCPLFEGKEEGAMHCHVENGPTFGVDCDLHINLNHLTEIRSDLGHSYELPPDADSQTYLAGSFNHWAIDDITVYKLE